MEPFSVGERKNPAPSRREIEISKVITEALEPAVMLEKFPRTAIDVYLEVLQADGGTRCAALAAASVALADAGIPMRDLVSACAAGKAADAIILDVNNEEDQAGQADMPIGYMPNLGKITLLQLDGVLTTDEFKKCIELGLEGWKGGKNQTSTVHFVVESGNRGDPKIHRPNVLRIDSFWPPGLRDFC